MRVSGRRLIHEQAGFTLVEMMVTMMVMIVVLFALYNIFDSSVRVFSFGNNKVEAVENARLGLEKMEREVRAAYPVNKAGGDPQVLSSWTAKRVTFGNDLDGNGRIECVSGGTPCERITYDVYQPAGGSTYALGRANSVSGGMKPVVEFIDYTDTNNTGLSFKYYEKNGTTEIVPGPGDESKIAVVQVELKVKKEGASQDAMQVLATDIALRNRVGTIAPTSAGVVASACSDSSDNDGDGKVDFPDDPGCSSTSDTDETDPPACSDGSDNDTDGKIDFGSGPDNEPGCSNANDIDETDPTPPADTTPPDTIIDSGPTDGSTTTSTTADFGFSSTESSTFECRLDAGAWDTCTTPKSYPGLSTGFHTFQVRATDAAGNVDASPASRTWTVGSTPAAPVAANDGSIASPIVIRQGGSSSNNPLTINVLANDTGDSLTIQSFTQPSLGTRVTRSGNSLVYTADNGSADRGDFSFTYTVKDSQNRTATATVYIRVENN